MCNVTDEQKIRAAINGFVQKGFMFTAFDVTKFIRADGTRMSHRDVHDTLVTMFCNSELPDYTRDTVDVGAAVAPFVYYSQYSSVNGYDKDWLTTNPTQAGMNGTASTTGVAQPAPMPATAMGTPTAHPSLYAPATPLVLPLVTNSAAKVKQSLPDGKVMTKEGRLEIPNRMLKRLERLAFSTGWHPLDGVAICTDTNKILVRTDFVTAANQYPNYVAVKANAEGRIRICRRYLSKISKGNAFRVMQDGVGLTIAPY